MRSAELSIIERNYAAVRERIGRSCERAGRSPKEVTLVAVTKSVSADAVRILYDLGHREMGENRPQALWEKHALLPDDIRWHLIGHLQTNKVRRTLPMVASIDAVDSWRLAEALSKEAVRMNRRLPVLIEVNLTGEQVKHGFTAEDLQAAYPLLIELAGLDIRGMLAMARWEEDIEHCRPLFRAVRTLRDSLRSQYGHGPELNVLSMGMSRDFEIAIEAGATQVRIGSSLFEGWPE